MTATQYTPGPWKACRSHETFHGPMWDIEPDELADYEYSPFVSIEAESGAVVRSHDLFKITPANARLIASAPELLAALEEFCRECDGYLDGDGHPWATLLKGRAAIAKATGQTD